MHNYLSIWILRFKFFLKISKYEYVLIEHNFSAKFQSVSILGFLTQLLVYGRVIKSFDASVTLTHHFFRAINFFFCFQKSCFESFQRNFIVQSSFIKFCKDFFKAGKIRSFLSFSIFLELIFIGVLSIISERCVLTQNNSSYSCIFTKLFTVHHLTTKRKEISQRQ